MREEIPRINKLVYSIIPIFGCLASMTMGYFIVYLTMLEQQLALYHDYTSDEIEIYFTIMTATLPIGAFIGSFAYTHFIDTYGQKKSMMYMDYLAIFSVLLQVFSIYFPVVCISRFLMGFYCAIITGVIPSWIMSMTPSFTNGIFGTFNQLAIALGMAQAYFMGQFLQNNTLIDDWKLRIYIGLPIVINLVHLFGLHYLGFDNVERLIDKKQNMEVIKFMKTIYGPKWKKFEKQVRQYKMNPVEIQAAVEQPVSQAIEQQKKEQVEMTLKKRWQNFKNSFICKCKNWQSTKLSIMLAVANQTSGVIAIFQYSKQLFVKVEDDFAEADTSLLFLGFFQVLITFASGFFINKFGRRPMMLIGQSIIVVSLLGCALITLTVEKHEFITISLIFLYFLGYSISLGPLFMLYAIETYSDLGLIVKVYWGFMVLLTFITDYLIQQISISIMFFIFFGCSVLSFIYFFRRMVETKDKSRKEVKQLIEGNTFMWQKSDMLFTQSVTKVNASTEKSLGTI